MQGEVSARDIFKRQLWGVGVMELHRVRVLGRVLEQLDFDFQESVLLCECFELHCFGAGAVEAFAFTESARTTGRLECVAFLEREREREKVRYAEGWKRRKKTYEFACAVVEEGGNSQDHVRIGQEDFTSRGTHRQGPQASPLLRGLE